MVRKIGNRLKKVITNFRKSEQLFEINFQMRGKIGYIYPKSINEGLRAITTRDARSIVRLCFSQIR